MEAQWCERLIECFKAEQLRAYSVVEISTMGLSARTGSLLTTVGLPSLRGPYFMATNLTPFGIQAPRPAAMHKGSLVRVGVCNEASFVVDVVSDALWFVAPDPPSGRRRRIPVRFVNSHLDAYLECLCRARPALERQPDQWRRHDRSGEFESVARELESMDGEAFADPNSGAPALFVASGGTSG